MRIDGGGVQQSASLTGPINDNTGDLCLGAVKTGATPSSFWDGDLDAFGFGKFVPTTAQQDALYNAGAGTENIGQIAMHLGTVSAGALTQGISWDGSQLSIIGSLTAGGGSVKIDSVGISLLDGGATYAADKAISWKTGANTSSYVRGFFSITTTTDTAIEMISNIQGAGQRQNGHAYIQALSGTTGSLIGLHAQQTSSAPPTPKNFICLSNGVAAADFGVYIGNNGAGAPINSSCLLELFSTTATLVLPRMTTAQRDAMTLVDGMILYNTTTGKIEARCAGAWLQL